jgi:hypothetical protein
MTNQLRKQEMTDDVRHTAAVAADYGQLQGLVTATTGIGLIVWAFGSLTWAAVIIAIGVAVWTSYYEKRYGRAAGRGSLPASLALIAAALVVCMAGYVADGLLDWPVLVLPLIAAVCLFVNFKLSYRHVGVTRVHWAAAALLIVSAAAPVLGLDLLGARTGVFVLGAAMVAIGLRDHFRLAGAMKPVPHD